MFCVVVWVDDVIILEELLGMFLDVMVVVWYVVLIEYGCVVVSVIGIVYDWIFVEDVV